MADAYIIVNLKVHVFCSMCLIKTVKICPHLNSFSQIL